MSIQAFLTFCRHLPPAVAVNVNQAALRTETDRLADLGYDGDWMASVALVGIAGADKPAAVVLTRLRAITVPAPRVGTPSPPNFRRDEQCTTHLGELAATCRGCAADRKARREETT
jgi:hypothetical protein